MKVVKVAITGGTGFVGAHLAHRLASNGVEVVVIARGQRRGLLRAGTARVVNAEIDDVAALERAFAGCDAVVHCAGINRELGAQTYARVHVAGTRAVVDAAVRSGVKKIVLQSFLRARPDCGSGYHESKWAAEELVRGSGLDYTVLKAGMVYGRGDHMLDHLSHAILTLPLLATVGLTEKSIRPLAIDDLVDIIEAVLMKGRLSRQTVAVTGPEELLLSEAVRRVGRAVGRRPIVFPAPVFVHRLLARLFEWTMRVPLVARAQVQMLSEGITQPLPYADPLPSDLLPTRRFTPEQIASGLPERGRFGLSDLRCCFRAGNVAVDAA